MMELVEIKLNDNEFRKIRNIVYKTSGINLVDSKRALIVSRLYKRLRQLKTDSFDAYISILESDPDEVTLFINRITTNLTKFYREKNQFDVLRTSILPLIRENKKQKNENALRVWSAGCSTGEEVYTILFELFDCFHGHFPTTLDVRILGSDIDTDVLKKAHSGQYSVDETKGLPPKTLENYFEKLSETDYRVKEQLRKCVRFKRINLVNDEFRFKNKIDIIFCRNVVIYFDRETKKKIYEKFHAVLNDPGFFFSGHSENLFKYNHLFRFIEKSIYKKVG
jgi:chemotaxis protein methyltransferase CheR